MNDKSDFVAILFARNITEAEFSKTLLEDHDITVLIDDVNDDQDVYPETGQGVPILVPHDQVDEAELIIEQRSELDDEFDLEFQDYQDEDIEYDEFDEVSPQDMSLDDSDDEDIL